MPVRPRSSARTTARRSASPSARKSAAAAKRKVGKTAPKANSVAARTARRHLANVRKALTAVATRERAEGEKKYLKSDLTFLGVPVPTIRAHAKAFVAEHPDLSREDVLALADAAWSTDVHELRSWSVAILERRAAVLRAADLTTLETFLRRAKTWAHVDWMVTGVVAPLVERYATAQGRVDRWATDEDFWIRRSALLALMPGLRRGGTDDSDFVRWSALATPMLGETEFFIRKAIGWVLRETSKKRPALVRRYVAGHVAQMSGLTVREATKRLPDAHRTALLAAHQRTR